MNREFRFRVWNIEEKSWDNPAILEVFNKDGILRTLYDPVSNYVIQQYTGAKDKNDKEIWEGDIINYKDQQGTVEFFACLFVVSWGDQNDSELSYLGIDDMEVVGNIFEYKK